MTEATMTPELLPCPFCGGKALYGIVEEGGEANPDFGGHFIQCTSPNCHGCMGLRFACGDDPRPALRDAWNTRPKPTPDPDVAALVEALRKVMPIRVHDGADYAEVYFADGQAHSTQAMTMNPADWRAVSDAFAAYESARS